MNLKLFVFILSACFGLFFSLPTFTAIPGPRVNLGLDLQGGLTLLLDVETQEALQSKYNTLASTIAFETRENKILINHLNVGENILHFVLLDSDEKQKMDHILEKFGGLDVVYQEGKYQVAFSLQEQDQIKQNAIEQAIGTIRNRLDLFGLAEPSVMRQGKSSILVQLPGIKSQEEEQRAINLISKSAHLQMMAVDEKRNIRVDSMSEAEAKEAGDVILPFAEGGGKILLKSVPIIDGSMITDARVAYDQNSQPVVSFTLDMRGAEIFGDFSGNNIGKRMAIVLDNKVYSAPVIRERIGGGSGQISGNFTPQEASDLAIALRSGALSAPVKIVEKRSIGPSLGADSIKASLIALLSGFVLVLAFMIFYYAMAGLIAVFALLVNILLIVAIMAILGATLTLPGMAGIVLTVGMAVDANIIINERLRESLYEGKNIIQAIQEGYMNASRAIFDSNLTSVIAAVLLYAYGTGAIKGFAITMIIGIVVSILTAIIGTHGIYLLLGKKIAQSQNLSFWFGVKMELIKNHKIIDFARYSTFTFALSWVFIVFSFGLILFRGFNLGVDFSGGTLVQIQYTHSAPIAKVRSLLDSYPEFKGSQVSEFGGQEEILIKIPYSPQIGTSEVDAKIASLLQASGEFKIRRVDSVGPRVGKELQEKGILALSLSIFAILLYVSFRYEWKFALSAVLALMHDVLISAACVIFFRIDLNLEVIAALLTIIGYSINDTIIIFDRIREQIILGKAQDLKSVINDGLSSTLSRTLLTSITVLFVVLTLYIFGGEIIVGFSLPMLVGVVVGTYSSLFFAPRLIILLGFNLQDYRKKLIEKQKKTRERAKMREMYQNGKV